ncbi:MAG: hypothetical protein ACKVP7_15325 [Hyphomicrobiaceae bacterium]
MSSTTAFNDHVTSTPAATTDRAVKAGFMDRLIASRMRQGQARVSIYLLRQSDATLTSLGFTPEQIVAIRKTGEIPATFWR